MGETVLGHSARIDDWQGQYSAPTYGNESDLGVLGVAEVRLERGVASRLSCCCALEPSWLHLRRRENCGTRDLPPSYWRLIRDVGEGWRSREGSDRACRVTPQPWLLDMQCGGLVRKLNAPPNLAGCWQQRGCDAGVERAEGLSLMSLADIHTNWQHRLRQNGARRRTGVSRMADKRSGCRWEAPW
ncbi:hypothetical protein HYPSUDRAFT_54370 [Hypholoma sublateritium FD-334 SS-4]|uniref:Uncharacterized protein n=1 Tax=Hypholoma sublateritium (strain FD-334 SS-4) TaxID=945553 RepID=A0A0D2P3Z2_HYPSF|nr:hypothetical protein HYPSUDRAFT_54370 [Hypholoma sublateritium FD-334 SS-4]